MVDRLRVLVIHSVIALLVATSHIAQAADGTWYVVLSETKDDEAFIIEGADGRYVCTAMAYCLGLDPGDRMLWPKSPYTAVGLKVYYDDFARSCEVYSCDVVPSRSTAAPGSASPAQPAKPGQDGGGCRSATIKEPKPFMGKSGEVFVLSDGSVWKVGIGQYNYLYAYYPAVTLCDGTLIVEEKSIPVTQLK